MHVDFIASIGRDLLSAQLLALECAGPCAPLSSSGTTVTALVSYILYPSIICKHSRRGVAEGNGKRLDQITAAGPHTRPKSKTILLRAWDLREDKGSVCLTNP